jgi:hypothetical protein
VSGLLSTAGNVTGASFYTAPLVTNDAAVAPALESVQDQANSAYVITALAVAVVSARDVSCRFQ